MNRKINKRICRFIICYVTCAFFLSSLIRTDISEANLERSQAVTLPATGTMVELSEPFTPVMITGLKIDPQEPFIFEFLMKVGDTQYNEEDFEAEAYKLIKYFMTSLTIPEQDMWVNLSPYEQDRIIPETFGQTEMGRDLLAQDYLLKQLSATLLTPDNKLGQMFWDKIYAYTRQEFGTIDIPVDTFNKVWIVPEAGHFYEKNNTVYIKDAKLKVLLEGDYVSFQENLHAKNYGLDSLSDQNRNQISGKTKEIVKTIILPAIEKEVNEGKTFANLRQIYNSMLLSVWFKQRLKQHVLGQQYANQKKIKGINLIEEEDIQGIWEKYVASFKKGVSHFIKDEYDPILEEFIPKEYFFGGAVSLTEATSLPAPEMAEPHDKSVKVDMVDETLMDRRSFLGKSIVALASLSGLGSSTTDTVSAAEAQTGGAAAAGTKIPLVRKDLMNYSFAQIKNWVEQFERVANADINDVTFENAMDLFYASFVLMEKGSDFLRSKETTMPELQALFNKGLSLGASVIEKLYSSEKKSITDNGEAITAQTQSGVHIQGVVHTNRPSNYHDLVAPLWQYYDNASFLSGSQKKALEQQIHANLSQLLERNNKDFFNSYDSLRKGLKDVPDVIFVEETQESLDGKIGTARITPGILSVLQKVGFSSQEADKLWHLILDQSFYLKEKDPRFRNVTFMASENKQLHDKTLQLQAEMRAISEKGRELFPGTSFAYLSILSNYLLISGESVKLLNYSEQELNTFYRDVQSILPFQARALGLQYLRKLVANFRAIKARDDYLYPLMQEQIKKGKKVAVVRGLGHVHTLKDIDAQNKNTGSERKDPGGQNKETRSQNKDNSAQGLGSSAVAQSDENLPVWIQASLFGVLGAENKDTGNEGNAEDVDPSGRAQEVDSDTLGGINLRSDQADIQIQSASDKFLIPIIDMETSPITIEFLVPHILQINSFPVLKID